MTVFAALVVVFQNKILKYFYLQILIHAVLGRIETKSEF